MKLSIRTLFVTVAIGISCIQAHADKKAVIAQIINNYAQEVEFHGYTIKSGLQKATLCEVPFVTFKDNRAAFVFGQAYVPHKTCRLVFKNNRVFNVWRDERGFVGAYERSNDFEYEDSVPKKLLSLDDSKRVIRLILAIDAQGKVSLKNQN